MPERRIFHDLRHAMIENAARLCGLRAVFLLAVVLVTGCSAPEAAQRDVITVEGVVTARGNEPFVRYVLETPEGNYYALRIPEQDRREFVTPARLKVTGRNYVDDWDGRPFAHIDVADWSRVD